jgi:hypothetical protein
MSSGENDDRLCNMHCDTLSDNHVISYVHTVGLTGILLRHSKTNRGGTILFIYEHYKYE